jgi:hypothetical protein
MTDTVYMLTIFGIMLFCGLLGGLANWILQEQYNKHGIDRKTQSGLSLLGGYLVLGVVASFVIPLFLNMISSNLLFDARTDPNKWLVFAGFCLLAAVFSRSFLQGMYGKVMERLGEVQMRVDTVDEKLADVKEEVTTMRDDLSEEEYIPPKIDENRVAEENLEKDELAILRAMTWGRRVYRSISGLRKDAGLDSRSREEMKGLLEQMVAKGLLEERLTSNGTTRWGTSEKGRDLIGRLAQESDREGVAQPVAEADVAK